MYRYITYAICLISLQTMAQVFDEQEIIDDKSFQGSPRSVTAADMDGDTDLDLLVSVYGGAILWFENTDGLGTFGQIHVVTTTLINNSKSYPVDLDGDTDLDIISASINDDKLVWYKNLDGQGTFGNEIFLYSQDKIRDGKAYDLDGDGDNDIVSVSFNEAKVSYALNDGNGNFEDPIHIANNAFAAGNIIGTDIDNDNDVDLVVTIGALDTVVWYENLDGLGTFSSQNIINANSNGALQAQVADIDNDGFIDVVVQSLSDPLAWFKNIDGLGSFGPKQIINDEAINPYSVEVADLDNDGDVDVIGTSSGTEDGRIFWHENLDGLGTFGSENFLGSANVLSRSIEAADIDNDGDQDIYYSVVGDNFLGFNENLTFLATQQFTNNLVFLVFPNPTSDTLSIKSKSVISSVVIKNIIGQEVAHYSKPSQINVSFLQSGMYTIVVSDIDGNNGVQKFIKD